MKENNLKKSTIIIGSGIGGLGLACILSKAGYEVTLVEKNKTLGGKINYFEHNGFRFDMGPSWYLMPDVFENFFKLLGEDINKHLDLVKLDPSYQVVYSDTNTKIDLHSDFEKDKAIFENFEPGSSLIFKDYLKKSKEQYEIALDRFVYKNYNSFLDFFSYEMVVKGFKLSVFSKLHDYVKKHFKTDYIQKLMEYQQVFLGTSPYDSPALYNIMSHIDSNLGVYYPKGGINKVIEALENIAEKNGAKILTNSPVTSIILEKNIAKGVEIEGGDKILCDIVISNADMHHTETHLLPETYQTYKSTYWQKKTIAPSMFLMYLGIDCRYPQLRHHTLVFNKNWKENFDEIFSNPKWPVDPSFYVCAPSVTDPTVAPVGKENLFVLVPISPDLEDTETMRDEYSKKIIKMIEKHVGLTDLSKHIEFMRIYSSNDFKMDYNSYKGSALGLAHTLIQTAVFRPDTKSKKVKNLYYVGSYTNPGIGMPICLISAELAYKRIIGDKSFGPLKPESLTRLSKNYPI